MPESDGCRVFGYLVSNPHRNIPADVLILVDPWGRRGTPACGPSGG